MYSDAYYASYKTISSGLKKSIKKMFKKVFLPVNRNWRIVPRLTGHGKPQAAFY